MNRCVRCGRPLRDPVSIAIGMGAECRGSKSPSRRQVAHSHRIARGQAYTDKSPLIFKSMILHFTDGHWVSNKSGHISTDESIRSWLKKNTLAIFPDEYADSLIIRKRAIESALLSPLYLQGVCDKEIEELRLELYRVQDAIDSLEIEEENMNKSNAESPAIVSSADYRGHIVNGLNNGQFQVVINGQTYTRAKLTQITAIVDMKLKKPLPVSN